MKMARIFTMGVSEWDEMAYCKQHLVFVSTLGCGSKGPQYINTTDTDGYTAGGGGNVMYIDFRVVKINRLWHRFRLFFV